MKRFVLLCGLLVQCLKDVSSQIQPAVTSLENVGAKLTIIIPNTQQANEATVVNIRYNSTTGINVYLSLSYWSYISNNPHGLDVTVNKSERKVDINIKSVRAQDAGNYKCFHGVSDLVLDNCGQMLIVLRKPNPPVITVLSSPLEGETLKLSCTTNSMALPPDHGLPTLVWWMDQNGDYIVSGSRPRININAKNELELSSVQRTDKGQKFSCKSADGTIDFPKEKLLESITSNVYEVIPEYDFSADQTLSFGAFIGIGFGTLNFIIIIILVLYCLVFRKIFRKEKTTANGTTERRAPVFCPIFYPGCLVRNKTMKKYVPDYYSNGNIYETIQDSIKREPDYLIIVDAPPTRMNSPGSHYVNVKR